MHQKALYFLTLAGGFVFSTTAGNAMPATQQNALVQKYCAVCHTDAARNGGLSLQHFDAARVAPSLAAMLLSKLTGGASVATAQAVASDPAAAALIDRKMKGGAMGAAGIPIPDKATVDALIAALASEATGATGWDVDHAPTVTASILRESPSSGNAGEAAMYRLIIACNPANHEGEMQLAWSPSPRAGTFSAVVDEQKTFLYEAKGTETMGNGSQVTAGPAATILSRMPLPSKSLRIKDLFADQSVEFSFGDLNPTARNALAACFQ